jgi:hypothetical protein
MKKTYQQRDEARLARLDTLRGDETQLLDKFIRSGNRTMYLPLTDYAADSLLKKRLVEYTGSSRSGTEHAYTIADSVWNAWERTSPAGSEAA